MSQNKLINEIKPCFDLSFTKKFFAQIETGYKKAPFYKDIVELLKDVFSAKYDNMADLSIKSITEVYKYLGKNLKWGKSSILSPETKGMEKADRLIQICKDLGYQKYINVVVGQELYSKEYFKSKGVTLDFIRSQKIEYKQYGNDFIPLLSIIDVLMFNDINSVKEFFSAYDIV